MPADAKPLFRLDALRARMSTYVMPPAIAGARPKLGHWTELLLKPGGRLGFVVTNKWMRAGYGEPLRKFFGASAWVEQVVDFGHAKQIFPDADVRARASHLIPADS